MQLPFTVEQFFGVFREYNTAVWPAQVALLLLAIGTLFLIARPSRYSGRAVSAALAVLWAWVGVAYHLLHFVAINPAAYLFGIVSIAGSIAFAWLGVLRPGLDFSWRGGARSAIGGVLLAYALVAYPIWATAIGHGFPELPTFGLPCPTTIFTIGVMAFAIGPGVRWALAVPTLWSLVGGQATFLLDVKPDLGLLVAGVVAIGLVISPAHRTRPTLATHDPAA